MRIAKCNVGSPVYVPAGQYLNGKTLKDGEYARQGEHNLDADFAYTQEANGMLEIISIDGEPVVWASCCSGH